MSAAIEVRDLRKVYGDVVAVDGVSFMVEEGEIFGLLGPNGAGKTTTVECLEGLRVPTSGTMSVLGMDPCREGRRLRCVIGIQLQESALPSRMRVAEACDLFASFYETSEDWRVLLDEVGLGEKHNAFFDSLSGGQKQRLFIVLALLNRPRLVFLDELTTGLDPQARRAMWDLIRRIRERGTTVVLTTHYMDEAEALCDRVAIMDRGCILTLDSPARLVHSLGEEKRLTMTVEGTFRREFLEGVPGLSDVHVNGDMLTVHLADGGSVAQVVLALEEHGVTVRDLSTHQPSLEDVFLTLTGRRLHD